MNSFVGTYAVPTSEFEEISTRLLMVHNAFSIISWSGGRDCEGVFFDGIRRFLILARGGLVGVEAFEKDPKLKAAIEFLRSYGPITEIVPFLADNQLNIQ